MQKVRIPQVADILIGDADYRLPGGVQNGLDHRTVYYAARLNSELQPKLFEAQELRRIQFTDG